MIDIPAQFKKAARVDLEHFMTATPGCKKKHVDRNKYVSHTELGSQVYTSKNIPEMGKPLNFNLYGI